MYTEKDKVRVVVITEHYRIEGDMHVLAGSRLTDSLNSKVKEFLAVTDAKLWNARDGELMYETSYIAINRGAIDAIFPVA
ncbi:MAG: hypothetical protein IBX62_06045 [Coriobacteriia bacterium]|nr:hypothetical protein [Coriobacteriia bacterium]